MQTFEDIMVGGESFTLDRFVGLANLFLPHYLPESVDDSRLREAVNIRLVRHLATLGLIDEAGRQGREARYTSRHLLQLLVVRRLMALGYTTGAIKKLTAAASEDALYGLLSGYPQLGHDEMSPASGHNMYDRSLNQEESSEQHGHEQDAADEHLSLVQEHQEQGHLSDPLQFLQKLRGQEPIPTRRSRASPAPVRSAPNTPALAPEPPPYRPPTSASRDPVRAQEWVRIEVLPGLEIQVRGDFRLPPGAGERDELIQRISEELRRLDKERSRKGR